MKEIQIMQGRQKGAIQKLGGIPVGEFSMGELSGRHLNVG